MKSKSTIVFIASASFYLWEKPTQITGCCTQAMVLLVDSPWFCHAVYKMVFQGGKWVQLDMALPFLSLLSHPRWSAMTVWRALILDSGAQGMVTQVSLVQERLVGRRGSATVWPASPKGEKKFCCCLAVCHLLWLAFCVAHCIVCIPELLGKCLLLETVLEQNTYLWMGIFPAMKF